MRMWPQIIILLAACTVMVWQAASCAADITTTNRENQQILDSLDLKIAWLKGYRACQEGEAP